MLLTAIADSNHNNIYSKWATVKAGVANYSKLLQSCAK